jgi:hypothetical protein
VVAEAEEEVDKGGGMLAYDGTSMSNEVEAGTVVGG